ncbi:MAG TPA: AI-2E family transporter [Acidimicrobiales bacterium]|nr:AI-2E family transporter [Acidimicrobiales bacterium]
MAQQADEHRGEAGDARPEPPASSAPAPEGRLLIDVDPWSFVVLAIAAVVAITVFAIADTAGDVLTGIGVGVLVGVALSPVVGAVQRRWDTSRGLAVTIVGAGLTVGFAAIVTVVAPAAVSQLQDFSNELPSTVRDFYTWPIVGPRLEDADASGRVEEWIDDAPADIDDATLAEMGERLIGGVLSAVIVLVTALGVMVDGGIVVRRLRSLVPLDRRVQADRLGGIVYATFGSYFAGSLFVAALAGFVILCTGLLLGVPLAPVAGLWTTLTNLIPQIGGFLGGGFFVLLALTEGPVQAAIALAVFMAYQNLENNVISPAIVGKAVNLSPPTTMLAALGGAAAAGVPGALVATPLLGAVKAVYLDSRGEMPEPEEQRVHEHVTQALRRRLRLPRRSRRDGESPPED